MDNGLFPFSAIVGQDDAKLALIYNIINPRIGGVLLCGQKGTAKSTLVRSFSTLVEGISVVDLPLNATEDMLLGTIDMKSAILNGKREFQSGLLQKTDGNILYIDEVNLISNTIVNSLLDVAQSGINIVEREGVSYSHSSKFILVGTMNPEEGTVQPEFLDRFGLYVEVKGSNDIFERKNIIKNRIEFEGNPKEFKEKYQASDREISDKITSAKKRLNNVVACDEALDLAIDIALTANVQGHRADIIMLETAMAIAAYDGREEVGAYDIKRAAELVLPHRIRENISPQSEQQQSDLQNDIDENQARDNSEKNDIPQKQSPELDFENIDNNENNISDNNIVDDDIVQGEEIYKPRDVSPMRSDRKARIGSGRRSKTISGTNRGRYIGFNMPKKEIQDIAFDATLRAAAIHQTVRDKGRGAISINKSDIRVKKRENHTGTTIIFAVDASGSMGAKKRMKATKEAILSLLYDAYQKRDNVGMIAFRKDRAEQILPITRSVELAQKKLQRLPTGGRTPLSQGIMLGWKTIMAQRTKDKNMLPLFILITDGRANSEVNGNDPIKEAFRAAELINSSKINSIVIDTEKTPISLGLAKDIADRMGAEYIKVDELKAQGIKNIVSSFS